MPLRWKVSPLEHIVVCVFEGEVTMADVVGYFVAIEEAGASHYRRIIDATQGECNLTEPEVSRLAERARSFGRRGAPAPIAVVTGSTRDDTVLKNLRRITTAGRRLRAFPNIHEARRWLASEATGTPRRTGHQQR
jgi:hypothetical protein